MKRREDREAQRHCVSDDEDVHLHDRCSCHPHSSIPWISGRPYSRKYISPTALLTPYGVYGSSGGAKPTGAAVVMSTPDATDLAGARAWRRDVSAAARKRNIRVVGPGAFGVIRTDIGLNATFGTTPTLPGRLALVSQSGAVCTAMLDFAAPMHIGFSSVISLGGAIDVSFGELLDALVQDPVTDGILLYVESVGDARAFLSALRAAARIKPVVVLKAGRSLEPARDTGDDDGIAPLPDAVFDAALQRAGTVRVRTYTQLFAAARILAMLDQPAETALGTDWQWGTALADGHITRQPEMLFPRIETAPVA
jgi:acetyltransferase